MPTAYAPATGSSKSDHARKKASGTWVRMPAPSPERVGAGGAAVLEVAQGGQGVVDDVVAGGAAQRRHEGDATGVVLELAAVQAGVGGLGGEARESHVRVTVLGGQSALCGPRWTAQGTPVTRVDGYGHG